MKFKNSDFENTYDKFSQQFNNLDIPLTFIQKKKELLGFFNFYNDKIHKYGNVLEIGSGFGATSYFMSEFFNKVVTIDINENDVKIKNNNVTYITGNTHHQETIDKIENLNLKYDLIFIDADHSFLSVSRDLVYYRKFLNDDGMILFHDINYRLNTFDSTCRVDILWEKIKKDYEVFEFIDDSYDDTMGLGAFIPIKNDDLQRYLIDAYFDNTAFIISTHPDNKTVMNLTYKLLENIGDRANTILTSHCPIPAMLCENSKFAIYDKKNPMTFWSGAFWIDTSTFTFIHERDDHLNHSFAVQRNNYNGAALAKHNNLEYSIFINYDWMFHKDSIEKIILILDDVCRNNKKGLFLKVIEEEIKSLLTAFFIFKTDDFLTMFKDMQRDIENVQETDITLERIYYDWLFEAFNDFQMYIFDTSRDGRQKTKLFKDNNIKFDERLEDIYLFNKNFMLDTSQQIINIYDKDNNIINDYYCFLTTPDLNIDYFKILDLEQNKIIKTIYNDKKDFGMSARWLYMFINKKYTRLTLRGYKDNKFVYEQIISKENINPNSIFKFILKDDIRMINKEKNIYSFLID